MVKSLRTNLRYPRALRPISADFALIAEFSLNADNIGKARGTQTPLLAGVSLRLKINEWCSNK